MVTATLLRLGASGPLSGSLSRSRHAPAVIERNVVTSRNNIAVFVSSFFEPVFYLLSLGVGLGAYVGSIRAGGRLVSYSEFVAPAMLATSAMNGAITDTTFNVFFKLRYNKLYDAVLATPVSPWEIALGEAGWTMLRGLVYAVAFEVVALALGLVSSWWAVLAVPVSVVATFGFAGAGLASTTFMRTWQDFEWITIVALPLFLLSATFYPLSTYPSVAQSVVRWTPLYQAVDLERSLFLGTLHVSLLANLAYLLVLGVAGLWVTSRRLERLLLS